MSWQMWTFIVLAVIGLPILAFGLSAFFGAKEPGEYPEKPECNQYDSAYMKWEDDTRRWNRDDESYLERRHAGKLIAGAGVGVLTLATLILIFGCFTIVATRSVGIVTTFGKPSGATLQNGLHTKTPWSTVTEMDGAIQNDVFNGDHRVKIRLGNNSTADADVNVRWQIKPDAADVLFVQYKTFDNVKSNLVTRSLQSAMNETFASFDPLTPKNATNGADLGSLSKQVQQRLIDKINSQIDVLEVNVPIIDYDQQTEDKINQFNAEKANTAVAEQAKQTAQAQADANRILAGSVSNDPNVIIMYCIQKSLEKGQPTAGCWPINGAIPTVPVR
ncbi:SPFH domain-containing protein [Mycobacteroides abscessus]|uniref:SPFH domain-containing protein n=1 Tax=Mycobacteroides abscessus TaxID=36809 RepID=UPI00092828F8|nr:SPFH domain-containing protein [Mycobacteroides abscessus]DAZ90302.1 TPA_asm: membrane protein, Band-7 -like [Mycobacterium phage prophiFSQJ01-1]SII40328.1 putative alanine and valine rich protein [Mycobacteroides abscessus subsp. abscessus]SIK14918.1 putative alanine and valine rich protein [Mycobacteroides abscessus subsp. abscessus]SIN24920.1 putative alanine and valine rich protein [Mycobacteroides abscessus subsp. abscessus]SLI52063.1 putative alanine and valine rich protein [Mycobacte